MILKKSGTTTKLRRKTCAGSFVVKNVAEGAFGSPSFSRTKRPSVSGGESSLTALACACEAASSSGGTCWVLHEKVPIVKTPRERNSTLNKTDKTDNFASRVTQKNESRFHLSIDRSNIK